MDIDVLEIQLGYTAQTSGKKQTLVPVDDAHPFDLDSYISAYSGRTAVHRLIHIIAICPSIAPQAFQLAVQKIEELRDPSLYATVISTYEQLSSVTEPALPEPSEVAQLDPKWIEEATKKNQAEKMKLEVELKTYANNMIKESQRMGHRDLGAYFRSVGDYSTALKHHTKSREYCTTSQHVLDMCLSVLELLIEQRNYTHIPTYVFKADAALDAARASASKNEKEAPSGPSAPKMTATNKRSAEREKVQSKLDFATALSHIGQANYEKAAITFLKLGSAEQLGDWMGQLVAPGDIAIYGTLCALASLSRPAIKAQLLENSIFGVYIEQEPYVRELVEAYMGSNFKSVLDLLARYSTRHYIDIHLASHVHDLTNLIRNCAIVLYFQPFSSIKLERMSAAFGWTVEEVEQHVVALIQSGEIHGRVDSQNKILQAKMTDYRTELFARAIKTGAEIQSANRKLLLRMRLQQAELVIKAPKAQNREGHASDMLQGD
jgi:COP9 signalosome complex subunit 1